MSQDISLLIDQLRSLRKKARRLRETLVDDLRSFQNPDGSFFTLPSSNKKGISIATTCTALMALVDSSKLDKLLTVKKPQESPTTSPGKAEASVPQQPLKPYVGDLFEKVVKETWESSELPDLNAFSTCMVIRAAGFLVSSDVITKDVASSLIHQWPSKGVKEKDPKKIGEIARHFLQQGALKLGQIIAAVGEKAEDSFAVPGYPPKAAMAYWFVDGVIKGGFDLTTDSWKRIAKWADDEFDRQFTYVVSDNTSLMDPAALAMLACLLARIKRTCNERAELSDIGANLATPVELANAVRQVYRHQSPSGIWNKYFPLFHFPGSGAADYCFSFEFFEALLIEFSGPEILADEQLRDTTLEAITKALDWCNKNRLVARKGEIVYQGWNAGGDAIKLAEGLPEAWATGVVHMFLWELESTVSQWLQRLILTRLGEDEKASAEKWVKMIDVDLVFPIGDTRTLKGVIEQELIAKATEERAAGKEATGKTEQHLRRTPMEHRRSALLFGPPGTSKTSIARGIAGKLGWPLLIITPSEFLSAGLEQIYARVSDVFLDLMDLSAVVVLFDEMDALAQTRGNTALDVTRQLLTTSMLPKLADLHERGRVIFLMATNHRRDLDPAITRPGRFDLLICVGPPSWDRKIEGIGVALEGIDTGKLDDLKDRLRELSADDKTKKDLDYFTIGDLRSFAEYLLRRSGKKTLMEALKETNSDKFKNEVHTWAEDYITLKEDRPQPENSLRVEYGHDLDASRIQ